MARTFMPKSGTMMPYVVLNRDAAVAGVFTVDGLAGSIDLTGKYLQITDFNTFKTQNNSDLAGKAAKGVNNDITGLLALQGPLRLGGDAATDSQAVTLRQLISAIASANGNNGATLNGVMNNFIGAVEWFNGTRAALVAGHLASDGQLLKRADYPELWNAISTGLLSSVSDALWLDSGNSGARFSNRGLYSTGDGSTTFRLPDLNGVQSGSLTHVYLSALNPNSSNPSGIINGSSGPNIKGSLNTVISGNFFLPTTGGSGALSSSTTPNNTVNNGWAGNTVSPSPQGVAFDASKYSNLYRDGVTEFTPNTAFGVWIIRVNGKFSASDTNFNVINGTTVLPGSGGIVYGGDIRSVYQLNGVDNLVARMRAKYTVGGTKVLELGLVDTSGSTVVTTPTAEIGADGSLALKAALRLRTANASQEFNIAFRSGSSSEIILNYTNGVSAFNFNNLTVTGLGSIFCNGSIVGTDMIGYGTVQARGNAPAQVPPIGNYLSSPSLRSYLWGRGGYGDPNGAFFGFYHQENVGNYARGVFELNGYGITRNWLFSNDGSLAGPGGLIQGAASDIRLKNDIVEAKSGAGDRIDSLGTVEYLYSDTGKTERGFLSQQAATVDPLYVAFGGENENANGEKFEILNLLDRAILADVVTALQEARAEIKALKAEVTELKAK